MFIFLKTINTDSNIPLSRQFRNEIMRRQRKDHEVVDKHFDGVNKGTKHFSKVMVDQTEDNSAYQELGEIMNESQYGELSSHNN